MLEIHKLIEIIKKAGAVLRDAKVDSKDLESKEGHQNFVTTYDKWSQEFLESEFTKLWPEYSFIGEEKPIEEQLSYAPTFIVDPIDGTTNFMHGITNSCISVAVVEKKETVQAVIYNFFQDELFYAEKGKGAFLNGESIKVNKLSMQDAVMGVGTSPYYAEYLAGSISLIHQLIPLSTDIRRMGSAALDLCYVACGRFGGFVETKLQLWDYAAGILICEEAGAKVSDLRAEKLQLTGASSVIAANPNIYEEFFEKIDFTNIKI